MTMDSDLVLVLASKLDAHADAVVYNLHKRGVPVVRLDVEEFWPPFSDIAWRITNTDNTARLRWNGREISSDSVQSIYCRDFAFAKCDPAATVETQLIYAEARASLYGFFRSLENRYWMNPPWYDHMADNKPYQMACASSFGLRIPRTLVTNNVETFRAFYEECNQEVIIKQLSEICLIDDSELKGQQPGYDNGSTAYGFYTKMVLPEHLEKIHEIVATPCLFQEHVRKKADVRVTIVGDQIFSALIDSQSEEGSRVDFRLKPDLPIRHFNLPDSTGDRLLSLARAWHLEFAACDFALTPNDELVFLEANVEGNWLWIEHGLGLPISKTIVDRLTQDKEVDR
jgi:glutathione synthase/RimK-type ligase-like ATP-grasp enzyme